MSEEKKKSPFAYEKKSAWELLSAEQNAAAFDLAEKYKAFLDAAKTEREAVEFIKKYAEAEGKKVVVNKNKAVGVVVAGKRPVSDGVRIVISHIDSPRLDIKPVPLFEDSSSRVALFETHYYGGIKKYQWLTIPLALHGVVIRKDGVKVPFCLGEDEGDPVFTVPDLLPHLSHKVQDQKKMGEAFKGEHLDVLVGSMVFEADGSIKNAILEKLHDDYGVFEADFVSAELECVPVFKARDIGFDRSMIGGYGQDDRVCAYSALKAICEVHDPEFTCIGMFVDKEEIGSDGNTGAQASAFVRRLIRSVDSSVDMDEVLSKSKVVSADVNAAVTPNFTDVFELKNASVIGCGVSIAKYTGSGGKYSANDASAEFVAEIRSILEKHGVPWQTGELGKVDNGGGGTVAKYFSRLGMDVIDMGPALISMHAPYEVSSKADVYCTYLAYKAFLEG